MGICPNLSFDLDSYGIACITGVGCAHTGVRSGGGVAMRSVTGVLSLCLWGTSTHSSQKNQPFPLHSTHQSPTFRWPSLKNTGGYTRTANYFFYKELEFDESGLDMGRFR